MKNTFLFLILVTSAFFFSCTNNQKSVIDGLQAQVDSLQAANSSLSDQQSEISDFLSIITQSLDSIAEQENYIRMAGKGQILYLLRLTLKMFVISDLELD